MAAWLNHHHLQYFRVIAQEGGISAAGRKLSITHSTLSTQLKQLEDVLGRPLFDREGRRLVLTPFGEQVLTYAEAIHRLGAELLDFSAGVSAPEERRPFRVVVTPTLPKTIVFQLLASVLADPRCGPVDVRERPGPRLLGDLTAGRAHVALSDEPVVEAGVHSHLLGSSGLHWYGAAELAHRFRRGFPGCLNDAPSCSRRSTCRSGACSIAGWSSAAFGRAWRRPPMTPRWCGCWERGASASSRCATRSAPRWTICARRCPSAPSTAWSRATTRSASSGR
ncbi:MAG: LysR family transcriptional regulator [Myxococcaceae bacterium]|nr:LysR family transcriptional regulator [Myxococcaceae bacterium]